MALRNRTFYRCHLFFLFTDPETRGLDSFWARGLKPIGKSEVKSGELVELVTQLDADTYRMDVKTTVRFDILEEDHLLTGGEDDPIISLVGTGARTGEKDFPVESRHTHFRRVASPGTLEEAVQTLRRDFPNDFTSRICIFHVLGPPPRYTVLTWWEARRLEDFLNAEMYFITNLGEQVEDRPGQILDVTSDRAPSAQAEERVPIRLTGTLIDALPFDPATPEPLPEVKVRLAGRTATSGAEGRFTLDSVLVLNAPAPQIVEVRRPGIDALDLTAIVTESDGTLEVTVSRLGAAAPLATRRAPKPVDPSTRVEVELGTVPITVHKIRGTVRWPDSRNRAANHRGTPLARRRVYARRMPDGPPADSRPQDTITLSRWKHMEGVFRSGRPGQASRGQLTDHDGAFEIKFIDLSVGRRYWIWVESEDPTDPDATIPEHVVRTFHTELLELTGSRANLVDRVGHHLIDHTYNLAADSISRAVEGLKIVEWVTDFGDREIRAIRPTRGAPEAFDLLVAAGDSLPFDPERKLLSDLTLQSLPLVSISEPVERRSEHARSARALFSGQLDVQFPRGHGGAGVHLVLDLDRVRRAIDLSAGAWDGAWDPGDPAASIQRRLCELLEKTFLVHPGIPSAHVRRVDDAHWRCDAITLADFADIRIPAPPPAARAVVANREVRGRWVPVLQRVVPARLGLSAGRHILLMPGHGFFDDAPPSASPADWASERGGYNFRAGEDENDAYLAADVQGIARFNGLLVSAVRELDDLTAPGVEHHANNTFRAVANPDFLRLWQQNPMYFLGSLGDPVVIGTPEGLLAGDHNGHGIVVRRNFAQQLAARPASPIDLILAIHTNAAAPAARGVSSFYLDVAVAIANPAEHNTISQGFATRLRDALHHGAHLHRRNVASLRTLGRANSDLQNTYDHWEQPVAGSSATWARVRAAPGVAGWQHRAFPRHIPVSLVEAGFHSNAEDAALLTRAWFRRRAAEEMAGAVEDQFRAVADPITRADAVRLLAAAFGPTRRIAGLVSDAAPITAAELEVYIDTATGHRAPTGGRALDHAVNAVEAATRAYTRSRFFNQLRDLLVDRCAYGGETEAAIAHFVVGTILHGEALGALARPAMPLTWAELGEAVALAFGWRPATLATALAQRPGGQRIVPGFAAGHEDRSVPGVEAADVLQSIRTLRPIELYRLQRIDLGDDVFMPLPTDPETDNVYAVRQDALISIVAQTRGTPWAVEVERLKFTIGSDDGYRRTLEGGARTRDRLASLVWPADLPIPEDRFGVFRITLELEHKSLRHDGRPERLAISKEIRVARLL